MSFFNAAANLLNSIISIGAVARSATRGRSASVPFSQSAESKKFHRDRATGKRVRKGKILVALAERGVMQFSDTELVRRAAIANGADPAEAIKAFNQIRVGDKLSDSDYHETRVYRDVSTNTIDNGRSALPTIHDIKTAKIVIDGIKAEQAEAARQLPAGCHFGPLLGEITVTDPELWERIIAHPDIKPKNKRKRTIHERDFPDFW